MQLLLSTLRAEISRIKHPANLHLALIGSSESIDMDLHKFLPHFDCLFARLHLEDGIAADELLCFGESAIFRRHFSARTLKYGTPRYWHQSPRLEPPSRLNHDAV